MTTSFNWGPKDRPRTRARRKTVAALLTCVLGAAVGVAVVVLPSETKEADAHGSVSFPASRTYSCRFEQPDNTMCAGAWSANSQALYDWMEVNIGDAAGQHQARIPDGQLCSAGRDKYAAFNTPGDWPLTQLSPNSSGQHEIVFTNTAPHATEYYRIYLTAEGFDARTDTLNWSDLELVHDSGAMDASPEARFQVSLPERTTPAILYVVWQRSDSPEAFYSCSDVTVSASGSSATTSTTAPASTTTTAPSDSSTTSTTAADTSTTSTTAPTSDDGMPFSPVDGIEVASTDTAVWATGYCREVQVTNTTDAALSWEVHDVLDADITALWDAESEEIDHEGHEGHVRFWGRDWNERLAAGQSTTFGMCVQ